MKIFSASQIKDWDTYTIKNEPISSINLMERASAKFCDWFVQQFSKDKRVIVFCGPGNNGGDGLAISRLLFFAGYKVETFSVFSESRSEDYKINEKRILECFPIHSIHSTDDIPEIIEDVVIDALFGSGLNRPLEGLYAEVIHKINSSNKEIVSVDIASGLFCDSLNSDSAIVRPNYTITFQCPKLSFVLPQNEQYIGELKIVNIGLHEKYRKEETASYSFIEESLIQSLLKRRTKFSHKGTYGTALIIAGSYGMMGAAVLSVKACLRTGVGLCVSYIPESGYEIMQTSVPENMVVTDRNKERITAIPDLGRYNAIGVGPGLGKAPETTTALHHLLSTTKVPLVIDADALNILAENKELISAIPENSILTPHPKEFERLVGPSNNEYERLEKLKRFASTIKSVVVLKGAITAVAIQDGRVFFNSTGNPGMATAGSGDVLTGIITSLLAQGYTSEESAIAGVYLHGYAGDLAVQEFSQNSILATDIINGIHGFYKNFNL